MPNTPAALRGRFYTTNLYARCPEFKRCIRCQMCANFNIHNALCVACEDVKGGKRHICNENQLIAVDMMEKLMGKPIFDINAEPSSVTTEVRETAFNNPIDKMIREIGG